MSNPEPRQERIAAKIAASQDRLDRTSSARPALPSKDAYPPEDYRTLAGEYPWLAVAAGLGVGLLAGALVPKKAGSQFTQRAISLAMVAGEIALALNKQGTDESAKGAGAAPKAKQASTGVTLAREAIKLAARARR